MNIPYAACAKSNNSLTKSTFGEVPATTVAEGLCSAISKAKFGPDSATIFSRGIGKIFFNIWEYFE